MNDMNRKTRVLLGFCFIACMAALSCATPAPGRKEPGAYNDRGLMYYEEGDYDQAIADYEAVLRITPDDADVRDKLEAARRARGQ
jgi:tetratricopeptide (TPR) repeat protein